MEDYENLDFEDINIDEIFDTELSIEDEYKIVQTRYCKPKLFRPVKTVKYKYAKELAKELHEDILNGDRVYAIISGNFIFGDFIEAFLEKTGLIADEITLSTLSISKENVDSLRNCFEMDQLNSLNLIISDYFFSHNRENISYIYEELDIRDSFQLAVAGIHTKTILIRMLDGKKIVIHGSANLRSSSSMEQIMIETNEELYDFNYDWQKKIIHKYATIRKSIRGEKLWQAVAKSEQVGKERMVEHHGELKQQEKHFIEGSQEAHSKSEVANG